MTPEEYFSELGRLQKEFPELSKSAVIQLLISLHEEEEENE
jgi:hypothetical protein